MATAKINSQMFISEVNSGFVEVKIEDTSREEVNELADRINETIGQWSREKSEAAAKAREELFTRINRREGATGSEE